MEVWAPLASSVDLVTSKGRLPMNSDDGQWFRATNHGLEPGHDYAFSLDGGPPLPDPRSAHQPAGVHGPSRVVDHDAHRWSDEEWTGFELADVVLYELHVGTFSPQGNFGGVLQRLDHLVELGMTAVSLMPVAEFPGLRGWGYDGVSLFAPHSGYGGPAGFKALIDACHSRGLGVVLDVVYNHLGPEGNHLGQFGPYFTDNFSTPWGGAVNFHGPLSDEVRRFVIDNALMWMRDYHCDGLRLDAVHAIVDISATHILEELASEVGELSERMGKALWLIAESDLNDPRVVRPREMGGFGVHAQWSDDFHHALHTALTGEHDSYYADFAGVGDLGITMRQAWLYTGQYSPYRRRRHGRAPTGISGSSFLAYMQTHDQVGNRARGDRIGAQISPERQQVGAALYLLSPFVPMIFQGEEWTAATPFQYFTSFTDSALGHAVSKGRRAEFAVFGWDDDDDVLDPQDPATFERSRLRWEETTRPGHARMLEWYRS